MYFDSLTNQSTFSWSLTGPRGEELCVDVAVHGDASAKRVVVVSSGTHGASRRPS